MSAWFLINDTLLPFSWFISGSLALFHALHTSLSAILRLNTRGQCSDCLLIHTLHILLVGSLRIATQSLDQRFAQDNLQIVLIRTLHITYTHIHCIYGIQKLVHRCAGKRPVLAKTCVYTCKHVSWKNKPTSEVIYLHKTATILRHSLFGWQRIKWSMFLDATLTKQKARDSSGSQTNANTNSMLLEATMQVMVEEGELKVGLLRSSEHSLGTKVLCISTLAPWGGKDITSILFPAQPHHSSNLSDCW